MKTFTLAMILAAGLSTMAAAEEKLNDLEIAHAAYTAGQIDIRYAHLALAVSENEAVRAFAETMIRDHSAVNEAAADLIAELDVVPQDNPLSRSLVDGAARTRSQLMSLSGAEFDCAYATNELGYHRVVNETVEYTFLPTVTVAPLHDLLADALETFKVHEAHAESMVSGLSCRS
jgi:putative membrane protein